MRSQSSLRGFTLIELLLVISLLGFISGVVLSLTASQRVKTRDARRVTDIREMQSAIELYYFDNGEYPKTFDPNDDFSEKSECLTGPTDFVPGIAPNYLYKLPTDPKLVCEGSAHSFFYASDGRNYKLITHTEDSDDAAEKFKLMVDPYWDGGPDECIVDGPEAFHVGVWTPGAVCWGI